MAITLRGVSTGLSQVYGFYVGSVSKSAYAAAYVTSIGAEIACEAVALNFLIAIPVKISHYWSGSRAYSLESKLNRLNDGLNIYKGIPTFYPISVFGITVHKALSPKSSIEPMLARAAESAKLTELLAEGVLCLSGKLCSGDQYGVFDWAYHNILH
jgi:hypothetical protein